VSWTALFTSIDVLVIAADRMASILHVLAAVARQSQADLHSAGADLYDVHPYSDRNQGLDGQC
jgi:hypothetical protein